MEDLGDKIEDLLTVFSEGFRAKNKDKTINFEINNQRLGAAEVIDIVFKQEVQWKFELEKQSYQIATEFFASMNMQQFKNHAFLIYKIQQLEKAIKDKDHYILYLEQNYKAVNGNEIIKKFHRINENQVTFAKPFDVEEWKQKIGLSYRSLFSSGKSHEREKVVPWRDVEELILDRNTWRLAQPHPAIEQLGDIVREADHYPIKTEPYELHIPPTKAEPEKVTRVEDYSPTKKKSPIKKSGLTSPRKRRKL